MGDGEVSGSTVGCGMGGGGGLSVVLDSSVKAAALQDWINCVGE